MLKNIFNFFDLSRQTTPLIHSATPQMTLASESLIIKEKLRSET